ncbi:hypothetical protein J6590_070043 [Homalodisca vitripennis]|nr:hypothetical protein J6590_070043 [Homalodisca vitripennis]
MRGTLRRTSAPTASATQHVQAVLKETLIEAAHKAAHTLDVQCTPCKHDVPKLEETCQCVEVSVLSTPCIAWHDGNQDRFDFRRAVPPAAVPSCKCVDQSRATC